MIESLLLVDIDSKALVGMSIEEAKIYIRTNFAETKCAEIIKAFEPK